MPPEAVVVLSKASLDSRVQPKLWLDDPFLTGICASAANVTVEDSPLFNPFLSSSFCQKEIFDHMIAAGGYEAREMRNLWSGSGDSSIISLLLGCCFRTTLPVQLFLTLILFSNSIALSFFFVTFMRSRSWRSRRKSVEDLQ